MNVVSEAMLTLSVGSSKFYDTVAANLELLIGIAFGVQVRVAVKQGLTTVAV